MVILPSSVVRWTRPWVFGLVLVLAIFALTHGSIDGARQTSEGTVVQSETTLLDGVGATHGTARRAEGARRALLTDGVESSLVSRDAVAFDTDGAGDSDASYTYMYADSDWSESIWTDIGGGGFEQGWGGADGAESSLASRGAMAVDTDGAGDSDLYVDSDWYESIMGDIGGSGLEQGRGGADGVESSLDFWDAEAAYTDAPRNSNLYVDSDRYKSIMVDSAGSPKERRNYHTGRSDRPYGMSTPVRLSADGTSATVRWFSPQCKSAQESGRRFHDMLLEARPSGTADRPETLSVTVRAVECGTTVDRRLRGLVPNQSYIVTATALDTMIGSSPLVVTPRAYPFGSMDFQIQRSGIETAFQRSPLNETPGVLGPDDLLKLQVTFRAVAFDANQDGLIDLYLANGGTGGQDSGALGPWYMAPSPPVKIKVTRICDGPADRDSDDDCEAWDDDDDSDYIYFDSDDDWMWNVDAGMWRNQLMMNRGGGVFEHGRGGADGAESLLDSRDAVAFDADGDGDTDLYVVNFEGPNELLLNDGSGHFVLADSGSAGSAGRSLGATTLDADGDGAQDLFVANYGERNVLLLNDGLGNFSAVPASGATETADHSRCALALDVDGDGDDDLYVVNYRNDYGESLSLRVTAEPNELLLNDGRGNFVAGRVGSDVSARTGASTGAAALDADGDGDVDIFVATWEAQNVLLMNDGSGQFTASGVQGSVQVSSSIGAVAFDADGDGDQDVVVANNRYESNEILINDGFGGFVPLMKGSVVEQEASTMGVTVFDADGDGYEDIYIYTDTADLCDLHLPGSCPDLCSNSGYSAPSIGSGEAGNVCPGANALFLSETGGSFLTAVEEGYLESRTISYAAVALDANGDGALDLFVANDGSNELFLNTGLGDGKLKQAALSMEAARKGFSVAVAAFDADGDGDQDLFVCNFDGPNQLLISDGNGVLSAVTSDPAVARRDNSIAVVTFDADGDGDIDIFVANAEAPNELLMNDGLGGFTPVPAGAAAFEASNTILVAAFDANGDGSTDLMITNMDYPGYQRPAGSNSTSAIFFFIPFHARSEGYVETVLLLSDGSGGFAPSPTSGAVPASPRGTIHTSLVPLDADGDGDVDVFVTTQKSFDFGFSGPSFLGTSNEVWINNGEGVFASVRAGAAVERSDLSVAALAFDADGDGDVDVYVVNSGFAGAQPSRANWNLNELLINRGDGYFDRLPIDPAMEASGDMSFGAVMFDADGDGDLDIFVANRGSANKLVLTCGSGLQAHGRACWAVDPPEVTWASPQRAPTSAASVAVVVRGQNFADVADTAVYIGRQPCASTVYISSTTLQCQVPPGVAAHLDVTVHTLGRRSTWCTARDVAHCQFSYEPPHVLDISPRMLPHRPDPEPNPSAPSSPSLVQFVITGDNFGGGNSDATGSVGSAQEGSEERGGGREVYIGTHACRDVRTPPGASPHTTLTCAVPHSDALFSDFSVLPVRVYVGNQSSDDQQGISPTVCHVGGNASSGACLCGRGEVYDGMAGACGPCPAHSYSTAAPSRSCLACPEGAACPGGAQLLALPGHWHSAAPAHSHKFYRCLQGLCRGEAAYGAVASRSVDAAAATINATRGDPWCRDGHGGLKCAVCADGFAKTGHVCEPCAPGIEFAAWPTHRAAGAVIGALVLMFVLATCLLAWPLVAHVAARYLGHWKRTNTPATSIESSKSAAATENIDIDGNGTSEVEARTGEEHGSGGPTAGEPSDPKTSERGDDGDGAGGGTTDRWQARAGSLSTVVRITVSTAQLLSSLTSVFDVAWPAAWTELMDRLSVLNLKIFHLPGLSCTLPNPSWGSMLWTHLLAPPATAALIALVFLAVSALARYAHATEKLIERFRATCIVWGFYLLTLEYLPVSAVTVGSMICENINGGSWLRADLRESCDGGEHGSHVAMAAVGVALYPIGIPALFLAVLYWYGVPRTAQWLADRQILIEVVKHAMVDRALLSDRSAFEKLSRGSHSDMGTRAADDDTGALDSRRLWPECPAMVLRGAAAALALDADEIPSGGAETHTSWHDASVVLERALVRWGKRNANDIATVVPSWPEMNENDEDADDGYADDAQPAFSRKHACCETGDSAEGHGSTTRGVESQMVTVVVQPGGGEPSEYTAGQHEQPAGCGGTKLGERLAVCSRAPSARETRLAREHLGFFFEEYRVQYWWFGLLDFAQRLVLTSVLLLVWPGEPTQVVVGILVSLVYAWILVRLRPFADSSVNTIFILAQLEVFGVCFLALLLRVQVAGQGSDNSTFVYECICVAFGYATIAAPLLWAMHEFGTMLLESRRDLRA